MAPPESYAATGGEYTERVPPAANLLRESIERRNPGCERVIGEVVDGDDHERKLLVRATGKTLTLEECMGLGNWGAGTLLVFQKEDGDEQYALVENLGVAGEFNAEVRAKAYQIGCDPVFPPKVQSEADLLDGEDGEGKKIIDREVAKATLSADGECRYMKEYKHGSRRVDFTDVPTMTIDPKSAKDFDDALSYREVVVEGKKFIEVGVHIADVTQFLPQKAGEIGRAIRDNAWLRQFTAYFVGLTAPMLPPVLSEKLCSLVEGEKRLAFSTVFLVDPKSKNIEKTWHGRTVIKSQKRFIYEEAEQLRTKRKVTDSIEWTRQDALRGLTDIGKVLREKRTERGAVSMPGRAEASIEYDGTSSAKSVVSKGLGEMNRVVEDWMLQANESMATTITERSRMTEGVVPTFLRIHPPPALTDLLQVAERLNIVWLKSQIQTYMKPGASRVIQGEGGRQIPFVNYVINNVLKEGERRHQTARFLGELLKVFNSAEYRAETGAHMGLAQEPYTHGTSPIRRYADIIVHDLLDAALAERPASEINEGNVQEYAVAAQHATDRENKIYYAEKQIHRMHGVQLLQPKVGEDIQLTIRGVDVRGGRVVAIFVEVPLPRGGFPQEYRLTPKLFAGFPEKSADALLLRGKIVTAKLAKAEIGLLKDRKSGESYTDGVIALEFVSAYKEIDQDERIGAVRLADLAAAYDEEITNIQKEFVEEFRQHKGVKAALERIQQSRKTLAGKTPIKFVLELGERIGRLKSELMIVRSDLKPRRRAEKPRDAKGQAALEKRVQELIDKEGDITVEEVAALGIEGQRLLLQWITQQEQKGSSGNA